MEGQIYKITFLGPVHFGGERLEDARFTCDAATLFSALFIEALACGCSETLLQAAQQGDFLISDCFPYIEDTYYLPKPLGTFYASKQNEQNATDSRSRKAAKKLLYIPANQMDAYTNGKFDFVSEYAKFKLGKPFLRMKANLTRSAGYDAELFSVGGFSYNTNCGIYFIKQGEFDIEPLMRSLSLSGLGGKRSSGYGAFDYTVESAACLGNKNAKSAGPFLLLSSALPEKEMLSDELLRHAHYKLIKRGGFVQSATYALTQRKKRDMWVFESGSVFSQKFEGSIFDVNDMQGSHPVYRYARAMWTEM